MDAVITRRSEPKVLVIVLAGGEGKRLAPLTADRAKPAVPFGGSYRIIDFVLSNFANARYLKIVVLTQYKSHSLDRHITQTWRFSTLLGSYVTPVPAQMRRGPYWFSGSADAIYQNLNLISDERPGHRVRVRRRPHLRHGSPADGRAPRAERCGGDRGGHPRAPRPGAGVRGDRGRPHRQDPRLPREGRRPADHARRRHPRPGVDGQLRVRHEDARRHRDAGVVEIGGQGPRGRRHPRAHGQRGGPPLRLLDQRDPRAGGARAGLLARRRDARRLLLGQHGPARRAAVVQPLQPRVAGLQPPAPAPAGQALLRQRRLGGQRRQQPDLHGRHRVRGPRRNGRSWGRTCASSPAAR